jgi:rhodanese-related sulfurtransferase
MRPHERWRNSVLGRIHAAALLGFVTVLAGCGATDDGVAAPPSSASATASAVSSSRQVGPDEFHSAIAKPSRVTINVHVPYEGDIPGTDLSIPFDRIATEVRRLAPNGNTPLAIYCRSGRMSESTLAALSTLGYADVWELRGGMQAWEASGRALVHR